MMNMRTHTSVSERRKLLEETVSVALPHIGSSTLDTTLASTKNCENMIGFTQIPVGIAGPLSLRGISDVSNAPRSYYVPLSTTEGALVASVNRGCKAITKSGGAITSAFRIGTTRGLVFRVSGIREAEALALYIYEHQSDLDRIAKTTSSHISLTDITVKSLGKQVFVRLVYNTQDAMGMNMVTIASDAIAVHLGSQTGAQCLSVAGNYDIDKKPAWINFVRGRGFESRAEINLTDAVIADVLKTTAPKIYDVWLSKCMIGSAMAGSMGFNAQYANIIAAVYLATGQDIAHVVEGSLGITTCEIVEGGLYMSVYLPDLLVGTVGGGTSLATQKEALAILGAAAGTKSLTSQEFAEVVGGAVLAGEVSLLASLSEGSLSRAHAQLGRGAKS